jgi:FtsP/CotA-like multicopper oxidase with cupredoxin domain
MMMGGMMGGDDENTWTINGKAYPNTDPLVVKQGDRVRVRLFNMSMEDHPMHLHGHSFTVLQYDGRPITPMVRDTLTVRHMESYDVEFVADNPGTWFFHCHNAEHMEGGLITLVKYQ